LNPSGKGVVGTVNGKKMRLECKIDGTNRKLQMI
jgi:hypothetical protein